eukprot:5152214-Alexandrium_andersonii.AAC.1
MDPTETTARARAPGKRATLAPVERALVIGHDVLLLFPGNPGDIAVVRRVHTLGGDLEDDPILAALGQD